MDTVDRFFRAEDGQDFAEYTLLLALVAMVSILMFQQMGASAAPIWAVSSTTMQDAAVRTS